MSRPHTQLATLLRRAQWMLDEAAYKLGGKQLPDTDRHALAEALDELAAALREHADEPAELAAGQHEPPAIVEPQR
ncbi:MULTISPECIES: hypothetical protein [Actinopolyspora]|uniref:Uncharacterized protein n=1 Tax=Actinopolyspora saharensis TaxID=995062 RepID=A0A1H1FEB3_9ACTN|nr:MULTISPECIES: hypothetical protein [Actinopolyspora]NHD19255.1 hypothetical protein [Actinopolyspora sp. BKK2]NHE78379.1 hypothetical protein [Actinopolyspora sp. BKK1]SDQ99200.1 hypothetical protein SAMN04489718_2992 [Actinopolyspora saharensis]